MGSSMRHRSWRPRPLAPTAPGLWSMDAPRRSTQLSCRVRVLEIPLWLPGIATSLSSQLWLCQVESDGGVSHIDNFILGTSNIPGFFIRSPPGFLTVVMCCGLSSGCQPLWLTPELDVRFGIAHCILPETLRRACAFAQASGMKVKGVMIVSPTYFGVVAPIRGELNACILPQC